MKRKTNKQTDKRTKCPKRKNKNVFYPHFHFFYRLLLRKPFFHFIFIILWIDVWQKNRFIVNKVYELMYDNTLKWLCRRRRRVAPSIDYIFVFLFAVYCLLPFALVYSMLNAILYTEMYHWNVSLCVWCCCINSCSSKDGKIVNSENKRRN